MSKIQPIIPTRAKKLEIPNCLKYLKMGASKKPINKNNPMNNVITLLSLKKSFANEITTNKKELVHCYIQVNKSYLEYC